MTPAESSWHTLKRVVGEALELPPCDRDSYLDAHCPDPTRRAEAIRMVRACEAAVESPVLEQPAAEFAVPILAVLEQQARAVPDALRAELAGCYSIEREVGRGGMATVYLARDVRHGRSVALKLLRPVSLSHDPTHGAVCFRREIEIAARLSHPHILPLFDSGSAGGLLYYVTPFVDGETLRDRLSRSGRPSIREALRLIRDVARALAHAHRQGLVHCDIKPSNILISREGDALVADFGVARGLAAAQGTPGTAAEEASADVVVLGTPAYMAPELVSGGTRIDHRADLYALGAVAYEVLTGSPPFGRRASHEQLVAHLSETAKPVAALRPEVPQAVAALVDRLLAKRPDERPRDADEVVLSLESALTTGVPLPDRDRERGTEDLAAYDLCQKGRFLLKTRQRDGLLRALSYFEEALARDPSYARAHAGMADAWAFLGIFGHRPSHKAFVRARAAADRALALDSRLVEAHATLAHLKVVYEWDWALADAALERAIALGPAYPPLRMYRASFLHAVGRSEEALAQLAVAREIDPLAPTGLLSGRIHVDTGRPDAAIAVLREEVDLEPRHDLAYQLLAHAYLQLDMHAEAVASMRRAAALSGPRDEAQLAYVYARVGDRMEARRTLTRLSRSGQALALLGFHLAMAHGALGDADQAFRWLEMAYAERASFMSMLGVATGFESLRPDPRFADLLRRMGLR